MNVALLSDIHGNTVALDAVLEDMRQFRPDIVVCLGDIAAGGPDPGGAIDRLVSLDCIAVQGNTDAGMVDMPTWWRDPSSINLPDDALPGMEITVWSAEQLTPPQRGYLAGLPLTSVVDLGDAGEMLAFHGSPHSADDLITATTSSDELDRLLAGHNSAWLVGGHTHVPLVRVHRGRTIANPGSVGMPFAEYGYAGGVPVLRHAAYAMVSASDGVAGIELRQIEVDADAMVASVHRNGMPNAEWWLQVRSDGGS